MVPSGLRQEGMQFMCRMSEIKVEVEVDDLLQKYRKIKVNYLFS